MGIFGRLVSAGLAWRGLRRFKVLLRHAKSPMTLQQSLWRYCMYQVARTAWGREREVGALATIADFQRTIPLSRYEDVFPYWKRAFDGEPNVFWPGYVRYWGMSSGTSSAVGNNKYIPLSAQTLRTNLRGGFDSLASYFHHTRDWRLLDGTAPKFLILGGSTALTPIPNKFRPHLPNYHGDNSGITAQFLPWYVWRFYSPGFELALLSKWEDKLERIAQQTRHEDIRLVSGLPSWMALLFERVRQLEGGRRIGEIWPNLRVFIHGGMSFAPYRDLFNALIGRPIVYVDSYAATEGGFIGVQDRLDSDQALLIQPDLGAFFEFVPVELVDQKHPEAHTLDTVRLGVNYALVMTTNAGLMRYVIGDTVKFVETVPPRFLFTGRVSTWLNFFGEHVIQSELEAAIEYAGHEMGVGVKDFAVVPVVPDAEQKRPRHRWFIEFAERAPADLARFGHLLDHSIAVRSNNLDYATHRENDVGLLPPEIVAVAPGTFHEWMKRRGKLGGQNKVPRAITDAALIASLQALVAEMAQSGAHEKTS